MIIIIIRLRLFTSYALHVNEPRHISLPTVLYQTSMNVGKKQMRVHRTVLIQKAATTARVVLDSL